MAGRHSRREGCALTRAPGPHGAAACVLIALALFWLGAAAAPESAAGLPTAASARHLGTHRRCGTSPPGRHGHGLRSRYRHDRRSSGVEVSTGSWPTPGPGTARDGPRGHRRPPHPRSSRRRWRTTPPAISSCSSAAPARPDSRRRTPGPGTARPGRDWRRRRARPPDRRRRSSTTRRRPRWSSSAVSPPREPRSATPGRGMG